MTPNLKAFLDMIAHSELGSAILAASDNGYNVIVGSTPIHINTFGSYKDHPRQRVFLPKLQIYSTAAGRYQILARYFDAYKAALGLVDFSPSSQDAIAVQMIKECGAIPDINAGHFEHAVELCSRIWASLPGAGYGQRENKMEALTEAFVNSGGKLA